MGRCDFVRANADSCRPDDVIWNSCQERLAVNSDDGLQNGITEFLIQLRRVRYSADICRESKKNVTAVYIYKN